jgi:hypothetical protein
VAQAEIKYYTSYSMYDETTILRVSCTDCKQNLAQDLCVIFIACCIDFVQWSILQNERIKLVAMYPTYVSGMQKLPMLYMVQTDLLEVIFSFAFLGIKYLRFCIVK